jgi:hypothetical protein
MGTGKRLDARDRELFAALADVVYGNPFSAQRTALIVRLTGDPRAGDLWTDPEALARLVGPRLAPWRTEEARARLSDEERRLLEPALLYVCYHNARQQLDGLIERQSRQPGAPLPVPFADEVIGELVRSGIDEERSERYFALFFQLRRAFYFIARSLAGGSDSMRRLREALWNNVFTHDMRGFEAALWNRMEDFSTLLLGETGTGKGQAAAAIGCSGFIPYLGQGRRFAANFTETFIPINLSQFAEQLIESELFGHRKGAFTGAIDHYQGVFERCSEHGLHQRAGELDDARFVRDAEQRPAHLPGIGHYPLIRSCCILLRKVLRLMPSISAASVWLPLAWPRTISIMGFSTFFSTIS